MIAHGSNASPRFSENQALSLYQPKTRHGDNPSLSLWNQILGVGHLRPNRLSQVRTTPKLMKVVAWGNATKGADILMLWYHIGLPSSMGCPTCSYHDRLKSGRLVLCAACKPCCFRRRGRRAFLLQWTTRAWTPLARSACARRRRCSTPSDAHARARKR